jgi:hypothetical protein
MLRWQPTRFRWQRFGAVDAALGSGDKPKTVVSAGHRTRDETMTNERPDLDPASALPGARPQPRVQVALDVTSIEEATRLATAALDAGADQLEIGKPLIEFLGLQGAASIMARFPGVRFELDLMIMAAAASRLRVQAP